MSIKDEKYKISIYGGPKDGTTIILQQPKPNWTINDKFKTIHQYKLITRPADGAKFYIYQGVENNDNRN